MKSSFPHIIKSISEYHGIYHLDKPRHPLVSAINYNQFIHDQKNPHTSLIYEFYAINLKKNFDGKIKYGQQYYDFDDGVMTFYSPNQLLTFEKGIKIPEGWTVIIHPDFLHGTPLAKKINECGFFSYAVNEALHLSEREQVLIEGIFDNLKNEIDSITDLHTQDVVLSHIDLLLSYCSRFYSRQFITRKKVSSDLLIRFESCLLDFFKDGSGKMNLPSVVFFADKLSVSPHYLNDSLKNLTGKTTQQHIQEHLIQYSKQLLTTTSMSVSEIAYLLGFEHPQSFSKLFKNKVQLTPVEYKQLFN